MVHACVLALARPLRRPAPAMPEREVTWSNPLGTSLTQISDNVWLAERPFFPTLVGLTSTDVGCKMVVVRLMSGGLWVHSPVGLDGPMRRELAQLGEVQHVVTPNTEHQKWAPEWIREYPDATGWACPGLRESKPEGGWQRSLEELLDAPNGLTSSAAPSVWEGEIELCWIQDRIPLLNRPFFNEVVFCHKPSATLIVTDLWWNYPRESDLPEGVPSPSRETNLWKIGMDKIYRPFYNGLMHSSSWDQSVETILSWNFEYIAPCHGEPVAEHGKQVLRDHLRI